MALKDGERLRDGFYKVAVATNYRANSSDKSKGEEIPMKARKSLNVANRKATDMIKKLIEKYFDYVIVGEYLDREYGNHYRVKYIKKWHLKKKKDRKKGGAKC